MATPYDNIFEEAARKYRIPVRLLKMVARAESAFNPNAGSPAGAQGIMQLMPGTAASLGVKNIHDPRQNIMGGAKYLSQQYKRFGKWNLALAAYNAGPGAVSQYNGVPPYKETQAYVKKIMGWVGQDGLHAAPGQPGGNPFTIQTPDMSGMPQQQFVPEGKQARIMQLYRDDPTLGNAAVNKMQAKLDAQFKNQLNAWQPAVNTYTAGQMMGQAPSWNGNFAGIKNPFGWLERKFGLHRSSTDNDAPGVHTDGSWHYQNAPWGGVKGYDYGDARNPTWKLKRLGNFLRKNPKWAKMVEEFYYAPLGWHISDGRIMSGAGAPGHGDHGHLAFNGWYGW